MWTIEQGVSAATEDDERRIMPKLRGLAVERDYARGWAERTFFEAFGYSPRMMFGEDIEDIEPTEATRTYVAKRHAEFVARRSSPQTTWSRR